jgi:thiamine pyrophosphokinase
VLVLRGAAAAEVRRAVALAGRLCRHHILVAVDGGSRSCRACRLTPDLFVGDGDSSRRVPEDVPAVVYPADKEFSDLSGALAEVALRRVQVVVLAGLVGGRMDHEWANLFEAGSEARRFAAILAPTSRGTVLITTRGCTARTTPGRTVSLLVLGGSATVSLHGARWELRRRRLRPGSHGLSNVTGSKLDLVVHAGAVALVFPPAGRS